MINTIVFNTGRAYAESGQRIAARRLECGAIVMIDIDRHIDYLLPADTALTQRAIMRAYDENSVVYPLDVGLSYQDYYAVLDDLRGYLTLA